MQILAAVKYVPVEELAVLAEAGIELVGENRAQDLVAKAQAHPGAFTWDFIGHLQSRKVRQVLPHVRYIETVASESALEQLGRHGAADTEILIEVNVAGEAGKSGIAPSELPELPRALPGQGRGADDDAPARADPGGEPGAFRGAPRARRRARPARICRWGPARTTWSPSRRARRLCGSARACTGPSAS